jgi:hypothetical protein
MIIPIKKITDIVKSNKQSIELFLDEDTNILKGVNNDGTIINFVKISDENSNNNSNNNTESKQYSKLDLIKNTIIFG